MYQYQFQDLQHQISTSVIKYLPEFARICQNPSNHVESMMTPRDTRTPVNLRFENSPRRFHLANGPALLSNTVTVRELKPMAHDSRCCTYWRRKKKVFHSELYEYQRDPEGKMDWFVQRRARSKNIRQSPCNRGNGDCKKQVLQPDKKSKHIITYPNGSPLRPALRDAFVAISVFFDH